MGETNGNHRSIFSMRSPASMPPSRVPRGRTEMAKSVARLLVAVMAVAAMALASAADTGLAQAQTNTPTDRDALVALYNATDGPNWRISRNLNWLSDKPLGEWRGVHTDGNGRVTGLNLHDNQLSGEIPGELGNLSNLEWLDLNGSQLSGEIPPELGSLSNLERLDLGNNQLLSGEIPGELGSLSNLERLYLHGNQLSGEIPGELGSLTNVTELRLGNNQLSGEIPPKLGSLTNLESLLLHDNQLSGEIPGELGNLSNLKRLELQRNELSGIPPELGSLSNLEHLNLQINQLNGEIPGELGSLSNLEWLNLQVNQLNGEIPAELGSLSSLEGLILNTNQLSGGIPAELGNLSNLRILSISGNSGLSGPLPGSFTGLTSLTSLLLSGTGLCAPTDAAFQAWVRFTWRIWGGVVDCGADQAGTITLSMMRPVVGAEVTATLSDPDGAVTGVTWQWARSLDGTTGWADIPGATSMSYTPTPLDDGHHLRATAAYTDPLAAGRTAAAVSAHPVTEGDPLVAEYDANGNGAVDRGEVITAINDYLFGDADEAITRAEVIRLINLYLFGPSPPTQNPPGAPTGLTAAGNGLTRMDLSWSAPSSDGGAAITGYRIEVSEDGSAWTDLAADTGSAATSYSDTGLAPGITRHYRVSAINSAGTGPASDIATGTTTVAGPQRAALMALYEATGGSSWSSSTDTTDNGGWNSSSLVGEWYGVTADEQGLVIGLDLSDNRLTGQLPSDLAWEALTNLEWLDLSGNQLSGRIPPQWGDPQNPSFPNLKRLDLSSNRLEGVIPADLGNQHLGTLLLNRNRLSGTIPSRWGEPSSANGGLPLLAVLNLSDNRLEGPIPDELGNIDELRMLDLEHNLLTGEIPEELGNLAGLRWLNLENNLLSGTIPEELGNLSGLFGLSLASNRLRGSIPQELGDLINLRTLHLDGQSPYRGGVQGPVLFNDQYWLSGSIPSRLGQLSNLEILDLSDNLLNQGIPTELGNLAELEELHLQNNQLDGALPGSLGDLGNLRVVDIRRNRLDGALPSALGDLGNLEVANLQDNQLTGPIPAELGNLTNLKVLNLRNNQFNGAIPAELAGLPNLTTLSLSNNRFGGSDCIPEELELRSVAQNDLGELGLPICLSSRTDRRALLAFYGGMSGEDWMEGGAGADDEWNAGRDLGDWYGVTQENGRVVSLSLVENGLVDRIAVRGLSSMANLGRLSELEELSLAGNELEGPIPSELGQLSNLTDLNLGSNQLSGGIPGSLGNLRNLASLVLANNQLTGPLPSSLAQLGELEFLYLAGNDFSGCIPDSLYAVPNHDLNSAGIPACSIGEHPEFDDLKTLHDATNGPNWTAGGTSGPGEWLTGPVETWHGVTISSETGDCRGRVRELKLGNNNLSGQIPWDTLGNLACLTHLDLSGNELDGAMPQVLNNAAGFGGFKGGLLSTPQCPDDESYDESDDERIYKVDVSGNDLSGRIPGWLGTFRCLEYLDLNDNKTSGRWWFSSDSNGFEGMVPSSLRNLSRLQRLDLSGNQLTSGALDAMPDIAGSESMSAEELEAALPDVMLGNNPWEGDYAEDLRDFSGKAGGVAVGELKGRLELDQKIIDSIDSRGVFATNFAGRGGKRVGGLILKMSPIGSGFTAYDTVRYLFFGGENPYAAYVDLGTALVLELVGTVSNFVAFGREAGSRLGDDAEDRGCANDDLNFSHITRVGFTTSETDYPNRLSACECVREYDHGTTVTGTALTEPQKFTRCCNWVADGLYPPGP